MDNVNFDDLYVLGKEMMVGLFKGKTERRKIFDLRKEDNLKDAKEQ